MKKLVGALIIIGSLIGAGFFIAANVRAGYEWTTEYGSQWALSVKASTIAQKAEYVDKFVGALDKSGLEGSNDAVWYFTPNNSFDENMKALKSLQKRLHDISGMNENDFAYQSAIQQITAQEQDDNGEVLSVLFGCWQKVHHPYLWNPFWCIGIFIGLFLLFIIGISVMAASDY